MAEKNRSLLHRPVHIFFSRFVQALRVAQLRSSATEFGENIVFCALYANYADIFCSAIEYDR